MNPGVIFDWDGVVVDSSSTHMRTWELLADKHNFLLPQNFFLKSFGRRNEFILREVLNLSDSQENIEKLSQEKEMILRQIVSEDGIEPLPGARAILHTLKSEQIPCAIATSTPRKNIDLSLEILDLQNVFSAVITSECVKKSKPAPDIFLQAAEAIQRVPAECIVIENTLAGIEGALSGNFKVVAVATTNPRELLTRAGAHFVADSLSEVSLSTLRALLM